MRKKRICGPRASRNKLDLALARTCMNRPDLVRESGLALATINDAFHGKPLRPVTLGRIAKALNADPAELIETEAAEKGAGVDYGKRP